METTRIKEIEKYYNKGAEHEWTRHERHRFEFPLTMRFLEKYITSPQKILDIGGGPGRYSIELSKKGHSVTLFDLAEENVKLAEKKALDVNISLNDLQIGDARDLSRFKDRTFDVVLLFGPLYHLSNETDRRQATSEALRVLKPGGIIACAFISHYAPLYDVARRSPGILKEQRDNLLGFLDQGTHIASDADPGFIDAYFCNPMEIEPFFDSFGVQKLTIFGAESFIAQSEPKLLDLDEKLLEEWIDFAYKTAETPGGIFGSDHIVYIGRKSD